jgi:DNA-binding XRE family transcriptional regulator
MAINIDSDLSAPNNPAMFRDSKDFVPGNQNSGSLSAETIPRDSALPTIVRSIPVDEFVNEVRNMIKAEMQPAVSPTLHVKRLRGFRQATGMSQSDLAKALNIAQSSVSSLEHANDLLFSTLSRYVRALGGDCEIVMTLKDNTRLALNLEQLALPGGS